MNWKSILQILHPGRLLDKLVDVVLNVMEAWAVVRVLIILILVLATMVMYVWENVPSCAEVEANLKEYHENYCISDWMHNIHSVSK